MADDFNPGTATIIKETRVTLPEPQPGQIVHGLPPEPKKRKYRNEPCVVGGIKFHSKKEARRWGELKTLEAAGEIRNLRRQVKFPLVLNGVKISVYTADFVYDDLSWVDIEAGERAHEVVEDTKSEATCQDRAYGIRKRLMRAIYGIEILET